MISHADQQSCHSFEFGKFVTHLYIDTISHHTSGKPVCKYLTDKD